MSFESLFGLLTIVSVLCETERGAACKGVVLDLERLDWSATFEDDTFLRDFCRATGLTPEIESAKSAVATLAALLEPGIHGPIYPRERKTCALLLSTMHSYSIGDSVRFVAAPPPPVGSNFVMGEIIDAETVGRSYQILMVAESRRQQDVGVENDSPFYVVPVLGGRADLSELIGNLCRQIQRSLDDEVFPHQTAVFLRDIVLEQLLRIEELVNRRTHSENQQDDENTELRTRVEVLENAIDVFEKTTDRTGRVAASANGILQLASRISQLWPW